MNTMAKQAVPSWLEALLFLAAVICAFLFIGNTSLDMGRWTIGVGIFIFFVIYIFLSFICAFIHSQKERKNFEKHLASLSPKERFAAIDERTGGMLTKLMASPQYIRAQEEFRRKFEKRLKPILDTLEKTSGPLSFSAQNQLEAEIKNLEKEMRLEKTPKTKRE